jgi:hypothetical protein
LLDISLLIAVKLSKNFENTQNKYFSLVFAASEHDEGRK